MQLSIITPSFNQGKFIKDTLDSVLIKQDSCDLEHIVFDGGSQDETVPILKEYSKEYCNLVWYSASDGGQSDAINKGLQISKGEIIAYINSDDYYLPDVLSKVLKTFQENPEVDFLYGDMFLVNASGHKIKRVKSLRTSLWHHFYSFPFPQQSCFWRRRILELLPEFNIKNKTCMDAEYFAHVLTHKLTFYRVSEPLACFRIHSESITGSHKLANLYKTDREELENQFFRNNSLSSSTLPFLGKFVKYWQLATRPKIEIFKT